MPPKNTGKTPRPAPPQPPATLEVVNPIWLLKAGAGVLVAALICAYLTLCLLFYQGQWQLILHPTRTTQPLTGLPGLPAEAVRFDASESGVPRLSGLWIPAPALARYPNLTILYLRSGDTSLAQSQNDARSLKLLHDLGVNLFAFDYRGYGQSDPTHPSQARMAEDTSNALRYLNGSRHIPTVQIVLYGTGLGASLATRLASEHPGVPGLILDSPGPRPIDTALADPRTSSLPVRLLFHEDFSLDPLATLKTPKLLISYPKSTNLIPPDFRTAADPKTTLELPPDDNPGLPNSVALSASIGRFLDQTHLN